MKDIFGKIKAHKEQGKTTRYMQRALENPSKQSRFFIASICEILGIASACELEKLISLSDACKNRSVSEVKSALNAYDAISQIKKQ